MVDEVHADGQEQQVPAPAAEPRRELPLPSQAERAFWRRAVAIERSRIAGKRAAEPAPPTA